MFIKHIALQIFCLNYAFLSTKCTLIRTTSGRVLGKYNANGKTPYYSYEGLPFGKPPVGDLRFMPPVPVEPWKHVLKAYAPGPVCPQTEYMHKRSEMNESCLFLNIYVPVKHSINPRPVVFVIHGGYYIYNSGNPKPINGPQLLLEKGIIVVTTNYRLGALGFLAFGDTLASGNAGLKDILLASKWVKSNIEKFKGDPNRISLLGWGVGGALAHYMLLTPQTSGIFSSAIILSGSALSYRSLQINPKENVYKLANQLGIKCNDNCCIKKLKEIDPFKIVEAETTLINNDPRRAFIVINSFSPVIEKPSSSAFITKNPLDIIRTEGLIQKIPILTGFNDQEGFEIFSVLKNNPRAVHSLNENFELCIPPNINYPIGSRDSKYLARSIREHYFDGKNINIHNVQNYINLITDTAYAFSIDYWIKLYKGLKINSAVYYYVFKFDGQLNWGKIRNGIIKPGAGRGDELGYVFLTNVTKNILPNLKSRTKSVLEKSLSMIKNFADCGNPTPTENEIFQWIESGPNRRHVVVDDTIINVNEPPLHKRLEFWYKQYEKYYEYKRRRYEEHDEFGDM